MKDRRVLTRFVVRLIKVVGRGCVLEKNEAVIKPFKPFSSKIIILCDSNTIYFFCNSIKYPMINK